MRVLDGWRILSLLATFLSLLACCRLLQATSGHYCTILRSTDEQRLSSPASAASYYTVQAGSSGGLSLVLGLSLSLHCLTVLHYLRYNNRFTIATMILWGAFFKVQRILLSVLPVAIGLLLLGVLVYSSSEEGFSSLGRAFLSLFALMNCDSIYETYVNLTTNPENNAFTASLYLTLTFLLFNTLILRLILAVVESLYFFLRLYTHSRKKRLVLRQRQLTKLMRGGTDFNAVSDDDHDGGNREGNDIQEDTSKSKTGGTLREDSSDQIQRSLLHIYAKSLRQ